MKLIWLKGCKCALFMDEETSLTALTMGSRIRLSVQPLKEPASLPYISVSWEGIYLQTWRPEARDSTEQCVVVCMLSLIFLHLLFTPNQVSFSLSCKLLTGYYRIAINLWSSAIVIYHELFVNCRASSIVLCGNASAASATVNCNIVVHCVSFFSFSLLCRSKDGESSSRWDL